METRSKETYQTGLDQFSRFEFEDACRLFEEAALAGDGDAHYALGICFENGLGTEVDREAYRVLMIRGAALGHSGCRGEVLLEGLNGERDFKESLRLMEQGANEGNPFLQGSLGFCYLYGDGDTPGDVEKAFRWLGLACAPGREGHWLVTFERFRILGPALLLEFLEATKPTHMRVPFLRATASQAWLSAAMVLEMARNG